MAPLVAVEASDVGEIDWLLLDISKPCSLPLPRLPLLMKIWLPLRWLSRGRRLSRNSRLSSRTSLRFGLVSKGVINKLCEGGVHVSRKLIIILWPGSSNKLLIHKQRSLYQSWPEFGEFDEPPLILGNRHISLLKIHKGFIKLSLARGGHPLGYKSLPILKDRQKEYTIE